jgi:TPM domain
MAIKKFSKTDSKTILDSIFQAEKLSSGEIRVFVEKKAPDNFPEHVIGVFKRLRMHHTLERNAVLIYLAMESRQFAIFGDKGIHEKMGIQFWAKEAAALQRQFSEGNIVGGLCNAIQDVGEVLKTHFPHQKTHGNQLPDNIAYGKN